MHFKMHKKTKFHEPNPKISVNVRHGQGAFGYAVKYYTFYH